VVSEGLDAAEVSAALEALGEEGAIAAALDVAVVAAMTDVRALSPLTSQLTVDYLERISRPIASLGLTTGAFITARGYVAHLVVEGDPPAYGTPDVPVFGAFPPLRRGQVPRDLLTRVVRAGRSGFPGIRAVSSGVWDGYVLTTTWRAQADDPRDEVPEGGERQYLETSVVDGLVRFGWVLRQVDIHYGLAPERA
jgi:hypothetical protein